MTGAAEEAKVFEWDDGPLDELLGLLGEAALTVRVEALRPGSGQPVGRLEVIAGGVLESVMGDDRGDEALAALKKIPGLRYRLEPALPHPDEGSLEKPTPAEGELTERPVTALMRYCEDYVLTCALELQRGTEHARISYRRGEIVRTLVDGSESAERLPDVIGWTEGRWRILLPQVTLPRRKKPAAQAGVAPTPAPASGTLFGFPAPVIPGITVARTPTSPSPEPARDPVPQFMPVQHTPTVLDRPLVTAPPTAVDIPLPVTTTPLPPPPMSPPSPSPAPLATGRMGDDTRATPPPMSGLPLPPPARPRVAPPRGFTSMPLVVHVLLGVGLGAAIVAGYWAYLTYLPGGLPGLR